MPRRSRQRHDTAKVPHPPRLDRVAAACDDLGRLVHLEPHRAGRGSGPDHRGLPRTGGGPAAVGLCRGARPAGAARPSGLGGVPGDGPSEQRAALYADHLGPADHSLGPCGHRQRLHRDLRRGRGLVRLPRRGADPAAPAGHDPRRGGRGNGHRGSHADDARPDIPAPAGAGCRRGLLCLRRGLGAQDAGRSGPAGGGGGNADRLQPHHAAARRCHRRRTRAVPFGNGLGGAWPTSP